MIAFSIVLIGFVLAWSVVGFAVAILFLKFRWNLVGGFLLATFGWLPIIMGIGALVYAVWEGKLSSQQLLLDEIYMGQSDAEVIASSIGYLLGIVVGTLVGLWPRRKEGEKNERWARTWPVIRTFVTGGTAVLMAWSLFFLADWRASASLRELRAKYADQLETQEQLALQNEHDTTSAHDSLLLSLLQETSPVWIEQTSDFHAMETTRPQKFPLQDTKLLQAFVPGSTQIDAMRQLVDRHQEAFQNLRTQVLEAGDPFHYWHPLVARLVAFDALVHLHDDDLDAVLLDMQLLRTMGTELLDERSDDCQAFQWFEYYRFLVFQAVLGKVSPVPEVIYNEMLQPIAGLRQSIHRALNKEMEHSIVAWIDHLLAAPKSKNLSYEHWRTAAIERMLFAESLPGTIEKLEQELNHYYVDETLICTPFGTASFPGFWNDYQWHDLTDFLENMVHQTNFSASHFVHYEMIRVAQKLEAFQQKHDRYPDEDEMLRMMGEDQWQAGIDLVPFRNKQSDETVGVLIFDRRHHNLDDHLGIYLGDSIFRLVDNLDDLEIFDKDSTTGNVLWKFDPRIQSILKPTLPEYGDSKPTDRVDPID
ncbi:hypothetical protein [Blastopirellula marina]|nr:hypothetical protein [Blastopirellula marina]